MCERMEQSRNCGGHIRATEAEGVVVSNGGLRTELNLGSIYLPALHRWRPPPAELHQRPKIHRLTP